LLLSLPKHLKKLLLSALLLLLLEGKHQLAVLVAKELNINTNKQAGLVRQLACTPLALGLRLLWLSLCWQVRCLRHRVLQEVHQLIRGHICLAASGNNQCKSLRKANRWHARTSK
jgi:hypothetical protein